MQCPGCGSSHILKNGKMRGKQNHICVDCRRQFIDVYTVPKGYLDETRATCLKMYVNGMGFSDYTPENFSLVCPPFQSQQQLPPQ
jgi:insertion element IS1 protein InsB